jgi:hypothetical protein
MAMFLDAVPYTHTDSVLGLWCVSLLTGYRFFFCAPQEKHLQVRLQGLVQLQSFV